MTNWWLVYLLSVSGGIGAGLFLVGLLAALAGGFFWCVSHDGGGEEEWRSPAKRVALCGFAAMTLGLLTPDPESIVRAYVVVEGAKVVDAENAEAAVEGLLRRVDKLIEAVGE